MMIRAYPRWLRPPLVLASAVAWASLLVHAALVAWAAARVEVRPPGPALLFGVGALTVAPWLVVVLARMAARGRAELDQASLSLHLPGRRLQVPLTSIAAAEAWRLPLPGPGVELRMGSGRPFRLALEVDDPASLLQALQPGASATASRTGRMAAWAAARSRLRPGPVERVLRWGLFPLLPAGILFQAHQHIAFGGALGEWRLVGPAAWLRTLAGYWVATLALLVLLAAGARLAAELGCALATALRPARAGAARRWAEWLCRAVLYAGVPALLALRFLA